MTPLVASVQSAFQKLVASILTARRVFGARELIRSLAARTGSSFGQRADVAYSVMADLLASMVVTLEGFVANL